MPVPRAINESLRKEYTINYYHKNFNKNLKENERNN